MLAPCKPTILSHVRQSRVLRVGPPATIRDSVPAEHATSHASEHADVQWRAVPRARWHRWGDRPMAQMTPEQRAAFLAQARIAKLVTLYADGSPTAVPVWF